MKPRTLIPLVGAGALLIATGIAVQVASADEHPVLTSEYAEAGFWSGGQIGTFTVHNPTTTVAKDWKISFGLSDGAKIAGVWNGVLGTGKNGAYTITPTTQNKSLAANGTITVGFTALTKVHVNPVNCLINGKDCKVDVKAGANGNAGAGSVVQGGSDGTGEAAPSTDQNQVSGSDNTTSGSGAKAGASGGATVGGTVTASAPLTAATPFVPIAAADRPALTSIAKASGAKALTLMSAVPSVDGGCQLKWNGSQDLAVYAKEITDAVNAKLALVASVGASNVDLVKVCGTAAALEAQLKRLVAMGIRTLDVTIPGADVADGVLTGRLAQVVKDLKGQVPGLSVIYTLPTTLTSAVSNPQQVLDTITKPLAVAKSVGAVIDQVHLLPVDLTQPQNVLDGLLGSLGVGSTVDPLLNLAKGLHDKLQVLDGLNAAQAWNLIGIVPVLGSSDLTGGGNVLATVTKLATFAKTNGLGLLGFLPLGVDDSCQGGLLGLSLPLLGCLDASVLPHLFDLTNAANGVLK
jgi:hypothetical protein